MAFDLKEINFRTVADPKGFIEECDNVYASRVKDAAEKIIENSRISPIVLMSGPSGSGKTTTARKISEELERRGEHFRLLLLPDHPTPLALRTHVREPIPFVIYDSEDHPQSGVPSYFDHSGDNGVFVADGDKLIDMLIRK